MRQKVCFDTVILVDVSIELGKNMKVIEEQLPARWDSQQMGLCRLKEKWIFGWIVSEKPGQWWVGASYDQ